MPLGVALNIPLSEAVSFQLCEQSWVPTLGNSTSGADNRKFLHIFAGSICCLPGHWDVLTFKVPFQRPWWNLIIASHTLFYLNIKDKCLSNLYSETYETERRSTTCKDLCRLFILFPTHQSECLQTSQGRLTMKQKGDLFKGYCSSEDWQEAGETTSENGEETEAGH